MDHISIELTDQVLDAEAARAFVTQPDCGGIVTFVGTTRNHARDREVLCLEFEAYAPMAVKEMRKIAEQIMTDWPAKRVAIHHRVGVVPIMEAAVVISVACPHRVAAFEACQYAIDTLKQTVPIWKKEYYVDGSYWVAAHP